MFNRVLNTRQTWLNSRDGLRSALDDKRGQADVLRYFETKVRGWDLKPPLPPGEPNR